MRTTDLEAMPLEQRQDLATEANDLYCTLVWCRRGLSPWSERACRLEALERRALARVRDRDLHSSAPRRREHSGREQATRFRSV